MSSSNLKNWLTENQLMHKVLDIGLMMESMLCFYNNEKNSITVEKEILYNLYHFRAKRELGITFDKVANTDGVTWQFINFRKYKN